MIHLIPINNLINLNEVDESIECTILSSSRPKKRLCVRAPKVEISTADIITEKKPIISPPTSRMGNKSKNMLDLSFKPGGFDVICARGSNAKKHLGNLNLRRKVAEASDAYTSADSRVEKSKIVSSIVDWVRSRSPHGGFVKQVDNGQWYEVGDALAKEKVGQMLRDRNHTHYRSSMKAKRRRWKQQKEEKEEKQPLLLRNDPQLTLEVDAAVHKVLQNHKDTINRSLKVVEAKWRACGGEDAEDEKILSIFACHNRFLLRTLKTDKTLHETISMTP